MEHDGLGKKPRGGRGGHVEGSVEAKLHGESKVIQSCFDDNNDDNKR